MSADRYSGIDPCTNFVDVKKNVLYCVPSEQMVLTGNHLKVCSVIIEVRPRFLRVDVLRRSLSERSQKV